MDEVYEGYVGEAEDDVEAVCESCLYWAPLNTWTPGPPKGCRTPDLDPKDPMYSNVSHTGPKYGCVHFIEWR